MSESVRIITEWRRGVDNEWTRRVHVMLEQDRARAHAAALGFSLAGMMAWRRLNAYERERALGRDSSLYRLIERDVRLRTSLFSGEAFKLSWNKR